MDLGYSFYFTGHTDAVFLAYAFAHQRTLNKTHTAGRFQQIYLSSTKIMNVIYQLQNSYNKLLAFF